MERLQELVDKQVEKEGVVDMWPEHWEQSGAIDVWKCFQCKRLFFSPKGEPEKIVIYSIEKIGSL
jgi:hypothetical protein